MKRRKQLKQSGLQDNARKERRTRFIWDNSNQVEVIKKEDRVIEENQ